MPTSTRTSTRGTSDVVDIDDEALHPTTNTNHHITNSSIRPQSVRKYQQQQKQKRRPATGVDIDYSDSDTTPRTPPPYGASNDGGAGAAQDEMDEDYGYGAGDADGEGVEGEGDGEGEAGGSKAGWGWGWAGGMGVATWKWYEVLTIVAFSCCACVIVAAVCVVPLYTTSMYDSLVSRTRATLSGTATDAAQQIGERLDSYRLMLEMYTEAVVSEMYRNVSVEKRASPSCFGYGSLLGVRPVYYENSSECNLGLSCFGTEHLQPGDDGYEKMMSKITLLMWGQTPYPNEMATSFMNKYLISGLAVIIGGFARMSPWFDLRNVSQAIIDTFMGMQKYMGLTEPTWTPPLFDPFVGRGGWKTRFYAPVYNAGNLSGLSALQLYIGETVAYMDTVSNLMPYDGYALITSNDGTLLAIPERGWSDWSLGNENFNFTREMEQNSFDPQFWNIFTNEQFASIGIPVNNSIIQSGGSNATGCCEVMLNGKDTIISWSQIPTANWIVIAVLDKDEALSAQQAALTRIITISVIMACIVLIVSVSIAIYIGVKRQYSHLSNKVADLHMKLEEAEQQLTKLKVTGDDVAVTALSSGLDKVTTVISRLTLHPDQGLNPDDIEVLKLANMLLMTRNFATIKPQSELTENQHQFILDCGMQVDERTSEFKKIHTKQSTRHHLRSNGRSANTSFSGISFTRSLEESDIYTHVMDDIPSLHDWSFDVFSVDKQVLANKQNLLSAVGLNLLSEHRLLPHHSPSLHLDVAKFLSFTEKLKEGYTEHTNPFHNYLHAADVTQAMNVLLQMAIQSSAEFEACLSPLDKLACIIATLSHDYKHPGVNNNFLKATVNPIYIHYGDAVLERMHAASALEVLFFQPECRALHKLGVDDQLQVHSTVMSLILATDMAKHIDIMETMKSLGVGTRTTTAALFTSKADPQFVKSNKMLVLQVLMKISDLSNVIRDWPVCKQWTFNLVNEFKGQGEEEKRQGIPTSKFMDGSTTPQEMQNTFIPLIVIPLLKTITTLFPNFDILEKRAWENLENWRTMAS
ncbi:cAMP-specific 3',5'-cAMP phosphodiesterase 4 [Pelomyxa schiedti]|nr:cAMP-specific 3',5'-cAMP phosphodiesterase 4 [Pelomyxa schiedti]